MSNSFRPILIDPLLSVIPDGLSKRLDGKGCGTGREAANHILHSDGLQEVMIKAASMHGPGLLPNW